jgi:ribosomal protein S12 methylthiotransferase accessory factor YcaO
LARLEAVGFRRALYYDFDCFESRGAHVVRVLVPGLEGYWTSAMALGARARARAAK